MTQRIEKIIHITASPDIVWNTLTNPSLMKQWMGEPEMKIEILTDWKVGSPILISGFHHVKFANKGMVLQFEPNSILRYDHLSSISRLPDKSENYTVIEFRLVSVENQTLLTLILTNFPTESIFRHLNFYWETTIKVMKEFIERR